MVFVPARFAAAAIDEAIDSGVHTVIAITEGIPVHDMLKTYWKAREAGVRLIGPNCPGVLSPGEANVGIIPAQFFDPGPIGVVSKSGTLTYQIGNELKQAGAGNSSIVGIGGDPIVGSDFIDILTLFEEDDATELIVMVGEIGGDAEERAADFIAERDLEARRRLHRRLHRTARQADGPRRSDHLRLVRHGPGEEGRARSKGRARGHLTHRGRPDRRRSPERLDPDRYSEATPVFRGQWPTQGGGDVRRGVVRSGVAAFAAGSAALGIALSGVTAAPAGEPADLPNVIVIQTDDQTVESMRVMEQTNAELAARGANFPNHVVNFPLCCPSRATMQTGQYAHNHGVLNNKPPNGGFQAFDVENTVAVWLQARGYVTAHVGKYMNGYAGPDEYEEGKRGTTVVPPGWTEWYTAAAKGQHVYNYRLNENGVLVDYGATEAEFKQDVFTGHAVQLIEEHVGAGAPLYLQLDYTAPHGGGPNPNPQLPQDCDGYAKPAPRHANAFDSEPLPMPDSFNELDALGQAAGHPGDRPDRRGGARQHHGALPLPARVAPLGGRRRCGRDGRAPGAGRARQHLRDLHRGQRLLPRRAPHSDREEPGL